MDGSKRNWNISKTEKRSVRFMELLEGDKEAGDCGNPPDVIPKWMDFERFERGRQFFMRHIGAVLFSCHCAITIGLSIDNILRPLVFTKKTDTPKKAYARYYKTFLHVVLWHIGDVWDVHSMSHKSVQKVRAMHGSVAKRLNETYTDSDTVYVSQFDMILVQFGFFSSAVKYPEGFGISCTREERGDYVFFWRGIGYLLGIDDKYNICSGTLDETLDICDDLEQQVAIPSLLNPPKEFDKMVQAYVQLTNLQMMMEIMTKEAIFAFSMDFSGLMEPSPLSMADRFRVGLLKFTSFMIRWCPGIEWLVNTILFKMFYYDIGHLRL